MNMKKLSILSLAMLSLSAGCTVVPGSSLSTRDKTTVYVDGENATSTNLNSRVSIYPITLSLLNSMRQPKAQASNNHALSQQMSAYQYRIGSGDVLNIIIWSHPNLSTPTPSVTPQSTQVSQGVWVDNTGYINYPLAGRIQARGKTLAELQNILTQRLSRYLKHPQLTVNVTEFRSQTVSVAGAVNSSGQIPITNIPLTLLDAINKAGGVTENADTQHVRWTHNGIDRIVSLRDLLQHGDQSQNFMLGNGDIVYVPTGDSNRAYVMGEVGKQTAINLTNHPVSLTEALGIANGINQVYADATGVFVIRNAPNDTEKPIHAYQLNLKDASAYALGNQFILQPQDVVYVTAAPITRWDRVISQLTSAVSNTTSIHKSF